MNRFDIGTFSDILEVGKGGEGTVFRATIKSFGRVAVKVYHSSSSVNHRELTNIYQYSHHPNIVRLLGFIENATLGTDHFSRRTGYVMEYMANGSVHDAIHKRKMEFSSDVAYSWICQTARAVLYLHENHVIHRDLKPKNLLLCDDLQTVKICDFGLTRDSKEDSTLTAGIGTIRYMAPEIIRTGARNKYDKGVDVYSLGITIWEILTKRFPYDHVPHLLTSEFTLCEAVVNGVRPETPANLHWDVQFIIENAWLSVTSARIQVEQILDFFATKLHKEPSELDRSKETYIWDPDKTSSGTIASDPTDPSSECRAAYAKWLGTLLRQSQKSGMIPSFSKSTTIPRTPVVDYPTKDFRVIPEPRQPQTVGVPPLFPGNRKETSTREWITQLLTKQKEELSMNSLSISDSFLKLESTDKDNKDPKAWEVNCAPSHSSYPVETITIRPSMGKAVLGFEFEKRWDQSDAGYNCAFLVTKVSNPSPASKAGLRVGDTIVQVNGKELKVMDYYEKEEFAEVVKNWIYTYPLVLTVKRQ